MRFDKSSFINNSFSEFSSSLPLPKKTVVAHSAFDFISRLHSLVRTCGTFKSLQHLLAVHKNCKEISVQPVTPQYPGWRDELVVCKRLNGPRFAIKLFNRLVKIKLIDVIS